ncbi:MAG: DUF4394 domain-containing protein [Acidobacteria bacterium]|nr:DUF4394 domain-containing protein [Acidobacteriota bacterium]
MKKFLLTTLTLTSLAITLTFVFPIKDTAGAVASAASSLSAQSVNLPTVNIFAIDNSSTLYVLRPGTTSFSRVNTISNIGAAQVIGIDFRVADGQLYALTDNGRIYTLNLTNAQATLVSTMSPRFEGGVQSLLDFNPVVNAIRLQGTNDTNFAVVNNGGNLNQTAVQSRLAYATGDRFAGTDPNICGGSYTNNFVGAANTIFYAFDFTNDFFVTIAPPLTATGSSNTGQGQLQAIGRVFDQNGRAINFSSTGDMDIVTINKQVNLAVIFNRDTIYALFLSQINRGLPVGQLQNLGAIGVRVGGVPGPIDIAITPVP